MYKYTSLCFALCVCTIMQAGWKETLYDLLRKNRPSTAASAIKSNSTLTEKQARDYVNQLIASLDHAFRPYMKPHNLNQLKQSILDAIFMNDQSYSNDYYGKKYKKDLIDQYVNSGILEYIEKQSYAYTYKKTKSAHIATRITESMRNNALAIIQQSRTVDFERLTPFVGHALKRAVHEVLASSYHSYYHDESYNNNTSSAKIDALEERLYPSEDCCSCFEKLTHRNRLFLKPCGHDMCKDCAYQWFFVPRRDDSKTCPQCRSKVNVNSIARDLASAPPMEA